MKISTLFSFGFTVLAEATPTPYPQDDGSIENGANGTKSYNVDASSNDANAKSAPIRLTNIISVVQQPAKVAREAQLLTDFISKVKKNEPGVLEFQLNLDKNTSQFLTYEIYKNQAAINTHLASAYLAALLDAENKERLKRAANQELVKGLPCKYRVHVTYTFRTPLEV